MLDFVNDVEDHLDNEAEPVENSRQIQKSQEGADHKNDIHNSFYLQAVRVFGAKNPVANQRSIKPNDEEQVIEVPEVFKVTFAVSDDMSGFENHD